MAVTAAQTAATLRGQAREARARDVARAAEVRGIVLGIVRPRLPAGARAWLIGTLAWGEFGARSDVDLVFEGTPDATITDIETELTRAAKVEVDALRLDDLPGPFRARVLREGIALDGG